MTHLTEQSAWKALQTHYQRLSQQQIRDLFTPERTAQLSLEACGIFLDYAKNLVTPETIALLIDLANAQGLPEQIQAFQKGRILNQSEQRQAQHVLLRSPSQDKNQNTDSLSPKIQAELKKMFAFSDRLQRQQIHGRHQEPITDIVNVGIGGSHLGPKMVCHALEDYAINACRFHFIANIDPTEIESLLKQLNPNTCLVIISSKSFTTLETLQNAMTIKNWLGPTRQKQLIGVTANPAKAKAFGIVPDNIFRLWDTIGGRYSVWSAIGLPVILRIGQHNFLKFLEGAHQMDQHFFTAPHAQNMPVILGLLSVWHINFCQTSTQAILPYSHRLRDLPAHLQQLDMESCGKSVTQTGHRVDYPTGSIIWGEAGTIGQHSFHQLLHQGTYDMPIDFILPVIPDTTHPEHQNILIASCLSQSQCLMMGGTERHNPHQIIPGNKPSNTLILHGLTPATLGALIALYEHKVFVQSSLWQINPFDQHGVEHGKLLTQNLLQNLNQHTTPDTSDPSTQSCFAKIQQYLTKTT